MFRISYVRLDISFLYNEVLISSFYKSPMGSPGNLKDILTEQIADTAKITYQNIGP